MYEAEEKSLRDFINEWQRMIRLDSASIGPCDNTAPAPLEVTFNMRKIKQEREVKFISSENEFIEVFGKPCGSGGNSDTGCGYPETMYMECEVNGVPSTPISTDEAKDKLLADLYRERHDMIDAMREKEERASAFEYTLRHIWLDLCDAYENKSAIKEVSRMALHELYHHLVPYMDNCPGYGDRCLSKKIKKEITQTKVLDE